jgi:polyhydroxyalkanoate synthesis regulator phasin
MADKETVTLKLPSGESVDFVVPSGMSDAAIKTLALSKRPDLFQSKEQQSISQLPNAALQAKKQLLDAPEKTAGFVLPPGAKPSGGSIGGGSRFGGGPMREPDSGATLNTLPAVGGTIGGAVGGIPGATLGGGAGEAMKQLIQRAAGDPVTQKPATDITEQGAIMGTAQGVGQYAISPLVKWLTSSKSFGAKMLQAASSKAGNAPVELSAKTNEIVDQIVQQGKLGGKVPKVISDLLERVGPSTKQAADAVPGPLTYDEARILQSNASNMSANEQMDLKGALRHLMPKFAQSFSQDVQSAANAAGVGAEHGLGMKEYAQAASRNTVLKNIGKAAAGSTAAYGAWRELQNLKK